MFLTNFIAKAFGQLLQMGSIKWFADQKTTDAALSAYFAQYYEKRALETLFPDLRAYQFAEKRPLPRGMGKTVQFFRWVAPAAVTSNMTELTVPAQVYRSTNSLSVTIIQRGSYTMMDELVDLTSISPAIEDYSRLAGMEAARTVDTYIYQKIGFAVYGGATRSALYKGDTAPATGTAAKIWSGDNLENGFPIYHNKTRISESANVTSIAATAFSVRSVQDAVKTLKNQNVSPMKDGRYVGLIHPEGEFDIMTATAWKSWNQYTSPEMMYRGEIGEISGVRFVMSTDVPNYSLSGDTLSTASGALHGCIIFGRGAYGATEIAASGQRNGFRIYIKRSGEQTTSDPVSQKITVGFKMTMGARVLNKSAGLVVLYTAV